MPPEPNPPNFAMLLGKRMDAKGGDPGSTPLSPPEGAEGEGGQHEEMKSSAASAAMDAMKTGDVSAFKQALEDFVEMCSGDYANDVEGGPDAAA